MNPMNSMHPVKRGLLTLGLVVPLAVLAALAPLGAGHRALAFEDPDQCPAAAGYRLAGVALDPATLRYADRNGDGLICLRIPTTRLGTVLLIETNTIGNPNICPAPFGVTTPARLPSRELVGDFRLVDRNGDGLVCIYQTVEHYNAVVIDDRIGNPGR